MSIVSLLFFAGCGQKVSKWDKQIVKKEIVIENLTKEYDLLFLTDMHILTSDDRDCEEVQNYAKERQPNFVNEDGNPAAKQWESFITYANKQKVDGVLLGGDIIDFPSENNLSVLKKGLDSLTMPYLYALGNHDWTYPWDYMTENGREQYLPMFYPYMKEDTAIQVQDFGEFYVVAVDNCSNQVNETVLPEYEKLLQEGKPIILLAHVPFYTDTLLNKAKQIWSSPVVIGGGVHGGVYPSEASQRFMELTTAEKSPVVAILAGHVHFSDESSIQGEKNVLQIVGDAGYQGKAVLFHITGSK